MFLSDNRIEIVLEHLVGRAFGRDVIRRSGATAGTTFHAFFLWLGRETFFHKVWSKQWRKIASDLVTLLEAYFASEVVWDPTH
jgi:hypothetical protein